MCSMPALPGCTGAGWGAGCAKYGEDGGVTAGGVPWPEGPGGDAEGVDWVGVDWDGAGGPAWKGCTGVQPTSNIPSAQTPAREPRPIRVIGPC